MTRVEEIVAAVEHLKPAQFVELRRKLDKLEKRHWEHELKEATEELTNAGINDGKIDQLVARRRHESRS